MQVDPGSPSAPNVDSGGTIPVTQTSAPVQIDEVLSSLQADTRSNLQTLVKGYGDALNGKPLPAEDLDQVPAVRGLTAAQALNKSLDHSAQALRGSALVNQGLLGVDIHDLSRLVAGTQRVSAALNANEGVLQDFVVNFNRTTQAFANQQDNLQQSVALLGPVVAAGGPDLHRPQRVAPRHQRVGHGDPARRATRRARRSTPPSRGSSRRASSCRRPSCRAS